MAVYELCYMEFLWNFDIKNFLRCTCCQKKAEFICLTEIFCNFTDRHVLEPKYSYIYSVDSANGLMKVDRTVRSVTSVKTEVCSGFGMNSSDIAPLREILLVYIDYYISR